MVLEEQENKQQQQQQPEQEDACTDCCAAPQRTMSIKHAMARRCTLTQLYNAFIAPE
jgi:hypothetical protein